MSRFIFYFMHFSWIIGFVLTKLYDGKMLSFDMLLPALVIGAGSLAILFGYFEKRFKQQSQPTQAALLY